jgi:hypothetical protein
MQPVTALALVTFYAFAIAVAVGAHAARVGAVDAAGCLGALGIELR